MSASAAASTSHATADAPQATAGSTGTATWSSYSNNWIAVTAVLRPDRTTYYYRLRSTAGTWTSGDSATASG